MTDKRQITVTLDDGRVLAFTDYDFTRGHLGSRIDPPESDEVIVIAAWWIAPDGIETECSDDELDALHGGPEYDEILMACADAYDAEVYAAMGGSEDGE